MNTPRISFSQVDTTLKIFFCKYVIRNYQKITYHTLTFGFQLGVTVQHCFVGLGEKNLVARCSGVQVETDHTFCPAATDYRNYVEGLGKKIHVTMLRIIFHLFCPFCRKSSVTCAQVSRNPDVPLSTKRERAKSSAYLDFPVLPK